MKLKLKVTNGDGQVTLTGIPSEPCAAVYLPPVLRIPAKIEVLEGGQPARVRTLPYGRDILVVSAEGGLVLVRMGDVQCGNPGNDLPNHRLCGCFLHSAGVVAHGNTGSGSAVTVMWGGVIHIVPVDSDGRWQVPFSASEIPAQDAVLYARAHGPAGAGGPTCQLALVPDAVAPAAPRLDLIGWAGGPRAGGRDAAICLSGSAEPGAKVLVAWGGFSTLELAGADGAWALHIPATAIPSGGIFTVCAAACDQAGNVGPVTIRMVSVGKLGDENVNVTWAGAKSVLPRDVSDPGVDISGIAEPGAELLIAWGGAARKTAAGMDGAWSVRFAATDLPEDAEGWLTAAVNDAGRSRRAAGLPVVVRAVVPSL